MAETIILGGQSFAVTPRPLGKLKVLLPALNRATQALFSGGILTEAAMADVAMALAATLDKSVEEVEALPMNFEEIGAALAVAARVSGLSDKGAEPGEARPGETPAPTALPTSTPSTP